MPNSLMHLELHRTLPELEAELGTLVEWPGDDVIRLRHPGPKPDRPADPVPANGVVLQWHTYPVNPDSYKLVHEGQADNPLSAQTLEDWRTHEYEPYLKKVKAWKKATAMYSFLLSVAKFLGEGQDRELVELVLGCFVLTYKPAASSGGGVPSAESYPLLQWRLEPSVSPDSSYIDLDAGDSEPDGNLVYFPAAKKVLASFAEMYQKLTSTTYRASPRDCVNSVVTFHDLRVAEYVNSPSDADSIAGQVAELVATLNSGARDNPVFSVAPQFVLFTRKRPDPYIRFLENASSNSSVSEWTSGDYPALDAAMSEPSETAGERVDPSFTSEEYLYTRPLTPDQLACVTKALTTPFSAVTGPPGTGKTYVIAAAVEAALARGERVLVTSENVTALSVVRNQLDKQIRPLSVSGTEKGTGKEAIARHQEVLTALVEWEKRSEERWRKDSSTKKEAFQQAAKAYRECLDKVRKLLEDEYDLLGSGTGSARLESMLSEMQSDAALPDVEADSSAIIDAFPLTESEDRYLRDLANLGFNFEDRELVAKLLHILDREHPLVEPATLRAHRDEIADLKKKIESVERDIAAFVPPEFDGESAGEEPIFSPPDPAPPTPPPLERPHYIEQPQRPDEPALADVPISPQHRDTLAKLDVLSARVLALKQRSPETKDLQLPPGMRDPNLRETLRTTVEDLTDANITPPVWRQALNKLSGLRNETLQYKQRLYDIFAVPAVLVADRKARSMHLKRLAEVLLDSQLAKRQRKSLVKLLKSRQSTELRNWFGVLYLDDLAAEVLRGWAPLDSPRALEDGLSFFRELSRCKEEATELGIWSSSTVTPGELSEAVDGETIRVQKIAEEARRQTHQQLVQKVQSEYQRECERIDVRNKEASEQAKKVNQEKQQLAMEAYEKECRQGVALAELQYKLAHQAWARRNAEFVLKRQNYIDTAVESYKAPRTKQIAELQAQITVLEHHLHVGSLLYEELPANHPLGGPVYVRRAAADEAECVATLRKQLESLKTLQVRIDPREPWDKLSSGSRTFAEALAKRWRTSGMGAEHDIRSFWRSSHSSGLIRAQGRATITDSDWKALANSAKKLDETRKAFCVSSSIEKALPRLQSEGFKKELKGLITTLNKMTNTLTSKKSQRLAPDRKREAEEVSRRIPVLITTTRQALDLFGDALLAGSGPQFDMVIVDEASQSPLESVVLLLLGKRVLVVGDEEQTSPQAVGVDESTIKALQSTLPKDMWPLPAKLDMEFSLFTWADGADTANAIVLREHNRCSPEIINLSNKLVYAPKGIELLPLKPRAKQAAPLVDSPVTEYQFDEDGINLAEVAMVAKRVSDSFRKRATDSVGVILLCGDRERKAYQTKLIAALLERKVDPGRVKIDSPAGFQGDERDVIVLALCVQNQEPDGTPRSPGGWNRKSDERALNVALSRARKQLVLVRSVNATDLKETDVRRKLLSLYDTNPDHGTTRTLEYHLARCHPNSPFERDVVQRLFILGYLFEVNEEVTGGSIGWRNYRVDITFSNSDGGRVGVELDGDRFHPVGQFEADWHRQKRLESAGWTILRVSGRRYYSNPDEAISLLQKRLADCKVMPQNIVGVPSTAE